MILEEDQILRRSQLHGRFRENRKKALVTRAELRILNFFFRQTNQFPIVKVRLLFSHLEINDDDCKMFLIAVQK